MTDDGVIVAVGFALVGVTGVVIVVALRVIGCTRLTCLAICLVLLSAAVMWTLEVVVMAGGMRLAHPDNGKGCVGSGGNDPISERHRGTLKGNEKRQSRGRQVPRMDAKRR